MKYLAVLAVIAVIPIAGVDAGSPVEDVIADFKKSLPGSIDKICQGNEDTRYPSWNPSQCSWNNGPSSDKVRNLLVVWDADVTYAENGDPIVITYPAMVEYSCKSYNPPEQIGTGRSVVMTDGDGTWYTTYDPTAPTYGPRELIKSVQLDAKVGDEDAMAKIQKAIQDPYC